MKRKGYRHLILIMDNATFHKARATSLFLKAHRTMIKPLYLPRYAPKLNEVDGRINRQLKKDISTNHTYSSIESLEKAARQYLTTHNRRHKLRDLT
mgnify:CR=1 FL=1